MIWSLLSKAHTLVEVIKPRSTKNILASVSRLMKMKCQLLCLINGMTHLRLGCVLINWSQICVPHSSRSYSRARAMH